MAMTKKVKVPERVTNPESKEFYRNYGNLFLEEGEITVGYRYDQVEKRKMKMHEGKVFTNNVTLSQPSSEVLTILRDGGMLYLLMGKQSRSPYVVNVDGTLYSRVFIEQAAGLLEEGQDFKDAAIAEGNQELGTRLVYLAELIAPRLFRHVSYSDESSKLYFAVTESLNEQHLDAEESISVTRIPLDEARVAFEDYINGKKKDFMGFDIPDVTMLSMSIFFWKIDKGEIDLYNLPEEKNII